VGQDIAAPEVKTMERRVCAGGTNSGALRSPNEPGTRMPHGRNLSRRRAVWIQGVYSSALDRLGLVELLPPAAST